ncbi:glycosyltransferase family A protein [Aphanizomenon sp. PH219]|uniref:Glycosyltransferase family 2 protein n=1 Tax=Dolichospermum heterosporum TAC447 TaxID=747523 RepID=A0ABY5M0S4_9CYAN|nr:glycosyltransferase family A protein [Dolichospermum heterosporum]MDK2409329.1 glycosyltransferase family A protein [Aphanizomenon sp. 202]MDK2458244.1 glycosyltransferase family A protein [Aphanizomenon sp. PH219]UUO16671.1 glycosyltransferase family 2 protein [Dolichospermum heterosporum TAC447]
MMNLPLVSVIIPCYNRERYLAEAIESVLDQTYTHIELIVIDDGSSDRSGEIAQSYPLKYHYQTNGGIGAARNTGIAMASGEFLSFLDSDDIWVKDKLAKQMAIFDTNLDIEAVFGYAQNFYSPELDENFRNRIRCPEQPIAAHLSSAILIKPSAFLRVGNFDTNLKTGIDISWYISAMEHQLQQITIPDVVYYRRLHESNSGITERQYANQQLHLIKAKLDRERAEQRVLNEES